MGWSYTDHAMDRCAQRNLSDDDIAYVIRHGRVSYRAGAKLYFLAANDVPRADRRNERVSQLIGTSILTTMDNDRLVIITVYRNRKDGLKDHRKKRKFDCRRQTPEYSSGKPASQKGAPFDC